MFSTAINLQAVLNYIADNLYTNIHHYDSLGERWTSCAEKLPAEDPLFAKPEVRKYCLSENLREYDPVLVHINSVAVYSLVRIPEGAYLVGPVQLPADIRVVNQLDIYPCDTGFYDRIRFVPMTIYLDNILLLRNLFHVEAMTGTDFACQGQYASEIDNKVRRHATHVGFHYHEEQIRHNPFDNEWRDLKAIEDGRIDQFEELWRDNYHSDTMSLLSRDPVRAAKYFTIMSITLASRAAVRGGALPETALTLCDSYVLQIDELKDPRQLESIAKSAWLNFAYLSAESKRNEEEQPGTQDNPIVSRCKDYVLLHLHEKIFVNQMADELHMNPTYLTNLFKKSEGVSLYQFILNEKIQLARSLLLYSSYSYIDIANYLGFSSQSHLSQVFRKYTGMSPKQYRDLYGKKDF